MEIGVKESSKKKLVRSTRACHVDKMGNEKLTKRLDAQKMAAKCRQRKKTEIAMDIALKMA